MNDEWELLKQDPDLYVTKEHMESIPKKPEAPIEEPRADTWEKVCKNETEWRERPRNDVPTVECGEGFDPLGRKHKEARDG